MNDTQTTLIPRPGRRHRAGWIVAVAGVLAAAMPSLAAGGPHGRLWREWETLTLKASAAVFLSGNVELTDKTSGDERRIETRTRARFLGATIARSQTLSRIDNRTGRTLEFTDRQPRSARRYRFNDQGYTVEKLKANDAQMEDAPLDSWEVSWTKTFKLPQSDRSGPPQVYDYFSLLMRLDELPLETTGDSTEVWVATSDGPQRFRIGLGEVRSGVRKIVHGGSRGRDSVPTEEIRLQVDAVNPETASDTFMGMRGETEIWVEARSRTLLEIRGKVPKIPGHVELSVRELR